MYSPTCSTSNLTRPDRSGRPATSRPASGSAASPAYVRFRCERLSESGFTELSVRADELTAPPPGTTRAYIVENEITYLAFPLSPGAIVIFGGGYAVPVLESLAWLPALDVIYWGDIDTHGFAILNRLRHHVPQARSILMDRSTLLAHRDQWVREPIPTSAALDLLDASELDLYRALVTAEFGPAVRLEQERISFSAIKQAMVLFERARWSVACQGCGNRNMPDNGLVTRRMTFRAAAAAGVAGLPFYRSLGRQLAKPGWTQRNEVQISGLAAPEPGPWIMITGFVVLGGCAVAFGEALREAIGGPVPRLVQGMGVLTVAAGLLRRDHLLLKQGLSPGTTRPRRGERRHLRGPRHRASAARRASPATPRANGGAAG